MTKTKKICVVTGTRAEYGLLYWVMKEIEQASELELQLVVTGMHLSPEFGLTYKVIEEDGFSIADKVEMLLSSDTAVGVTKSMGLGTIAFADVYDQLSPDYLMVLGDRFELLAAAQAALIARIPIIHLAGGDVTEGAFDEAIRHSITKMAHLHFVTNEDSGKRVRQLGENPKNIYIVGNPGLDHLHHLKLMNRKELEDNLGFTFKKNNVLVTFHSVTLDNIPSDIAFEQLLIALHELGSDVGILFTRPNADTGSRILINMIDEFVAEHNNSAVHTSLGQIRYLSSVAEVDAVVGNSSSGLLEVPSLKTPTVNIGDRQKGRLKASSVVDSEPEARQILAAIKEAFDLNCSGTINPYGDGKTAPRVSKIISEIDSPLSLVKKHFFDVSFEFNQEMIK